MFDREEQLFLSTPARKQLLAPLPIVSAPVICEGTVRKVDDLRDLIAPSLYKSTAWRDNLRASAEESGLEVARVVAQTDPEDLAEGLYLKWEEDGRVLDRYKYLRDQNRAAQSACALAGGSGFGRATSRPRCT